MFNGYKFKARYTTCKIRLHINAIGTLPNYSLRTYRHVYFFGFDWEKTDDQEGVWSAKMTLNDRKNNGNSASPLSEFIRIQNVKTILSDRKKIRQVWDSLPVSSTSYLITNLLFLIFQIGFSWKKKVKINKMALFQNDFHVRHSALFIIEIVISNSAE